MAHRRRRGSSGPRRPFKWGGNSNIVETTIAAGATASLDLIMPIDYTSGGGAGTMESGGATLARIRGQLSMRATVVGALSYTYIAVIGATEPNFGGVDPLVLTSGDVIWQGAFMVPTTEPLIVEWDIKSRRKLENDRVIFVITAVAQAVTFVPNARCGLWLAA